MNDDDIDLQSVNWEFGMLLTPEHFLRQERYIDSMLLWVLRYGTDGYGLVGGGARVEAAERGAAKHDPKIEVHNEEEHIKISVSQCRGITRAGDVIDIDPAHPVHRSFTRKELEGHNDLGIYVVCGAHDKVLSDASDDGANPQMKSSRRPNYRIELDITGTQAPHCLTLGKLRKAEGTLRYEKLRDFIPICTTLVSHSELRRAWEKLSEQLNQLADRYTQLHKAIVEYIGMAGDRGIDTRSDEETLRFVAHMVTTLESCAYAVLDPLQSPQRFFQQLYRAIRSAAIYLDLSPPTRTYFQQLAEEGETEFGSLLEQESQTLLANRELSIHDNLSVDEDRIERSFYRLRRLEQALEGKYLDFRVSTVLESLNFFFDRHNNPPALYRSLAKPSRTITFNEGLTFIFAPLKLEGKKKYRLILVGDPEKDVVSTTSLRAEIQLNQGTGQQLEPIYGKASLDRHDQRNFAIDFAAPSQLETISDVRVSINARWPIKNCLLYGRRFLQQGRRDPINIAESDYDEPISSPPVKGSFEPERDKPRPRLTDPDHGPSDRVNDWERPRRKRLE